MFDFGNWAEGVWSWNLSWTGSLDQHVPEAAVILEEMILSLQPVQNTEDRCCWMLDNSKVYKVSKYCIQMVEQQEWRRTFAWRVILDRIPTRVALQNRGIIDFIPGPSYFSQLGLSTEGKNKKKVRYMVWMAGIWVIWIHRNSVIFRGGTVNIAHMLHQVKSITWVWFANRGWW